MAHGKYFIIYSVILLDVRGEKPEVLTRGHCSIEAEVESVPVHVPGLKNKESFFQKHKGSVNKRFALKPRAAFCYGMAEMKGKPNL
jgi:hypothetical protein